MRKILEMLAAVFGVFRVIPIVGARIMRGKWERLFEVALFMVICIAPVAMVVGALTGSIGLMCIWLVAFIVGILMATRR